MCSKLLNQVNCVSVYMFKESVQLHLKCEYIFNCLIVIEEITKIKLYEQWKRYVHTTKRFKSF